jgi:hypothetical protein
MRWNVLLFSVVLFGSTVSAEEEPAAVSVGSQEIVVTGSRRSLDGYDSATPSIGLKRVADFAIQPVNVTGDTRDSRLRSEEMYQTIRRAIDLAGSHGVQLAFGEIIVEPLTAENYRDLTFSGDGRPDTSRVEILVKAPLAGTDAKEATARIDRFIKAIKPVGRALVAPSDDLSLSVVAPDQYRPEIARIIAADAAAMAAKFGPDYAVEVRGLNRPVDWTRASLTEVFLYIPYDLLIRPKP